jgi:carboxypeptidase PM20D1
MIRKIATLIAGLAVILGAFLIGRAFLIGPPSLADVEPASPINIDSHAATSRLADAVRIKTISHSVDASTDGRAMRSFHTLLEASYPEVHSSLKREIVNAYSLLYTWEGTDTTLKPILISAHIDVVPVEPGTENDWEYPPFSGEIADGFIWGRGTLDVKQSILGVLEAIEFLLAEEFLPERTIYLAFGHDEEIGGGNGAAEIAKLLADRGIRLEFVLDEGSVITEGIVPGIKRPTAIIGVTEKGIGNFMLVATGKGGHSSRPPKQTVVGAIGRAVAYLQDNPMPARLQSPVSDMFDYLAPEMPFTTRLILANRWLFEPLLLRRLSNGLTTNASIRSTITPTIIQGGVKANVIPQEATAVVNVRLLPGDTVDDILRHITEATGAVIGEDEKEHGNYDAKSKLVIRRTSERVWEAAPVSEIVSPSFATLMQTIRQVFPDVAIAPGMVLGATDV